MSIRQAKFLPSKISQGKTVISSNELMLHFLNIFFQLSEKIPPVPTANSVKESERHKVEMLEKEMAEQEVLLAGYQRENELLCAELRSVKVRSAFIFTNLTQHCTLQPTCND